MVLTVQRKGAWKICQQNLLDHTVRIICRVMVLFVSSMCGERGGTKKNGYFQGSSMGGVQVGLGAAATRFKRVSITEAASICTLIVILQAPRLSIYFDTFGSLVAQLY